MYNVTNTHIHSLLYELKYRRNEDIVLNRYNTGSIKFNQSEC